MNVLLTLADATNLTAGTEVYATLLKKVFPDLTIVTAPRGEKPFSLLREPLFAKQVYKEFTKINDSVDIIFTSGLFGWPLKHITIPVINIQHGGYAAFASHALPKTSLNYWRTRYLYSYFEKKSARKATRVVANSVFTQHNIEKFYGVTSTVITNAVDTNVFKKRDQKKMRGILNLPQDKTIILFVGRPDYTKGFDILLDVAKQRPDLLFVCVMNKTSQVHLPNVKIITNITQENLAQYYSAADVLFHPSRFEGFGYVYIEALACGTPVLSHNTGVLAQGTLPHTTCVENTVPSYVKALEDIPQKPKTVALDSRFSFDSFARSYKKLVRDLR